MALKPGISAVLACVFLAACGEHGLRANDFSEVYVEDFNSEDIGMCRPADVDLNNAQAREFFLRGRQVEHKVIHDHYIVAPCYIEGTLKYHAQVCDWQIRAAATGHVQCGKSTTYFVCDTCEALFKPKP